MPWTAPWRAAIPTGELTRAVALAPIAELAFTAISYDQIGGVRALGYEIGPDKDRHAGALANVAFFGTSRGGGTVDFDGPLRDNVHPDPAVAAEALTHSASRWATA